MSGQTEKQPEKGRGDRDRTDQAVFKPSRWPGLIWAVPAAALGIVAWLGISAFLHRGPSVSVVFPIAGGLKAGSTKVEYRGFAVGEVGAVALSKSLDHMVVRLDLISTMAGYVGPGTRFWISGNSFSFSDIASIKALVSGPFIGLDPKPGKTVHHAIGLAAPPVLKGEPRGETLTLMADQLYHISPGSPIFFKGYKVGEIRGVDMRPDGGRFNIYAFIEWDRENLLNSNSRFWNAGAVHLSTGGSSPGLQVESIPALFLGAVAFGTPAHSPGRPVGEGASFLLYPSESAARDAPGPGAVPYRVVFAGGPHGLAAGAPVQLEGAPAGVVTGVAMRYDPARGAVQTAVDLVLQPERIGLVGRPWDMADPTPQMNAMLTALVRRGLRAELDNSVPVVGGKIVQLVLVTGQPEAGLQPGNPPQIPSFGRGGGVERIITQINDILATVNALPLDRIAADIHQATSRLARFSESPETKRALQRLDRTVAHFEDMSRQGDAQVPAILDHLKRSAAEAQEALNRVQGLLSAQGPANASPESAGLPHALYELTLAAQSLRALTDFLNSHPNALILGRGK